MLIVKYKSLYITVGMHECQNAFPRQKECTNDKQRKTPREIYSKISF